MDGVIACASCGFNNWEGEAACARCAAPLAFIQEVSGEERAPTGRGTNRCSFCGTEFEGYFCTLCRKPLRPTRPPSPEVERPTLAGLLAPTKMKLIAAAVVVALTAAAALLARSGALVETGSAHAQLIRDSFDFQTPVSVSFAERQESLPPGVEALRELGLVNYRLGTLTLRRVRTDLALWTEDYTLAEHGEIVPGSKSVQFAAVTLTETGRGDSPGWGTYRPEGGPQSPWAGAQGWRVPLGRREFAGVRGSQPIHGAVELLEVVFAWRWRPNELGRHFDVSGEEFKRLPAGAQLSALSRDFNDSTETYTGRALLKYEAGAWRVQEMSFGDDAKK